MAKVNLNRLIKKYGNSDITGKKYIRMMSDIITHNTKQISKSVAKLSKDQIDNGLKKLDKSGYMDNKYKIPDLNEVLPRADLLIRKGAEHGQSITRTLRDKLSNDLQSVLAENPDYMFTHGKRTGHIRPKVIKDMQRKVINTFKEYTKINPKYGMPSNVKSISNTEVRSAVNSVKAKYTEKLIQENNNLTVRKRWRHNRVIKIKEPRRGHLQADMTIKNWNEPFNIRSYRKGKGGLWKFLGYVKIMYPHDPNAPASEVISCSCDYDILVFRRTK